jgi:hypothetical protein
MSKMSIAFGAAAMLAASSVAVAQAPPSPTGAGPPPEAAGAQEPAGPPLHEPPLHEPPSPPPPPPPPVPLPPPPAEDLDDPRGTRPAPGPPEGAPSGGPTGPEAAPVGAVRRGGTFEMSLGLGITRVSLDQGPSESFTGLSGLNLGAGGWVSPRTALTFRVAATSFVEQIEGVDIRFIAGFVGLSLQHMAADQAWVGIGAGLGVLTTDQDDIEPETGFGLDLRAGLNIGQTAGHAVHLAIEVTPGFYDGISVTGIGLQLGWQSF